MKFSLIVPVYNVERYLSSCLGSIASQTFTDFEVICVNDGSTDASREILESWKQPLGESCRVIDQNNGGLSSARNAGLREATGEYVLFIDSDDLLSSDRVLEKLASVADGCDMAAFNTRAFCDEGETASEQIPLEEGMMSGPDYFESRALAAASVSFAAVWQRCYRRAFLIDNNLFFKEGILHEDNHFTPIACMRASVVKVIDDTLYLYRVRPGSIMTTRSFRHWSDLVSTAGELSESLHSETACRLLTQYYQMALCGVERERLRDLAALIDWKVYRSVSRTKLRHRINYVAARISPLLFRKINK